MAKLGDVCVINPKGKLLDDDYDVSFVPMQSVSEDGTVDVTTIRKYGEVKKGFTNFRDGDILFAKITPCMENGKGCIVNKLKNGIGFGSTEFHVLRPKLELVTSEWIYYLTSWPEFRKECEKNMTGSAGQKRVPKTFLENYQIDIPSLNEQKKITGQLDKVRDLIAKRRAQLDKLDLLVKAKFVEMFGDPVSNPLGWSEFPLGERCKIITGNTPSRADVRNYGSFIEWIKSDNINTPYMFLTKAQEYLSEIGFQKCRFVDSGSLLMTCIAGSINCIGNVAVTDRKVAFNQQINAIVPNQDDVMYLYWLIQLSKPAIHHTINKALKGILSKGQLSQMIFPFPPIEEQHKFSSWVNEMEKMKRNVNSSLEKLETLKKTLLQQYFE